VTVDPGKYARPELERRFLLDAVPDGLVLKGWIEDRYVDGTRLRLRRVTSADGSVVHKLGQKVRVAPDDPSVIWLTTFYLDEAEHDLLSALPGRPLVKDRFDWPGTSCVVDVFAGPLAGLVLAEVERTDGVALEAVDPPPGTVREVSHDDRFAGGSLAGLTADEVADLLGGPGRMGGCRT
jgi:CYTH domain-containing protein